MNLLKHYYSAKFQIVLVGLVCFCCPGMFNALSGIGGGGQIDHSIVDNANTALYVTFIVFGLLGGGFVNLFGPRWTIFASGFTYALYSGSFIYYNHSSNGAFAITAGAILGIGAGILWAAQGMIMISYPNEGEKGRFIGIFWVIFNLGGVIGGVISFAINFNSNASALGDTTYIVFLVLECVGACLGLTLAPPNKVVRSNGEKVVLQKYTNVVTEFLEVLKLFTNKWMLLLFIPFFSSNFMYTYQFNKINGALFTIRTRSLNSTLYWVAQMIGSYAYGLVLDHKSWSRKRRAVIAFIIVGVIYNSGWVGSTILQNRYTTVNSGDPPAGLDFPGGLIDFTEHSRAAGPMILYFVFGICDAMWQTYCYWIMGCLTNDPQTSARYAGFYKGIQSLGAAIAWQVDAKDKKLMDQVIINWVFVVASLILFVPVIMRIKPTLENDVSDVKAIPEYEDDQGTHEFPTADYEQNNTQDNAVKNV
ncbi:hypothetical protein H4219_005993 [Mycoemilia scoparia]|uniref:Uncharacterized protein n=1 Tax=Mycoemilia scoparia TaxID=417184 RepID=A0A9W7ZV51_9FUNG|nr:hypothetical protein H4219_005993 [Mycoemilia scoparia]